MAEISKFRLSDAYLESLDALAAAHRGNRSEAVRHAIAYWHRAAAEAGAQNAQELTPADWTRLAHLNDPGPPEGLEEWEAERGPAAVDWSRRLAHELVGMWEGRVILPLHKPEADACRRLAAAISEWGLVRGYALYSALRHFWSRPEAGVGGGDWWHPETFMTPTAKDKSAL